MVMGHDKSSSVREYLALLVFIAILSLLLCLIAPSDRASKRDFICYWTSGQLLLHGVDPYSPDAVMRLERSQGYQPERPMVLRNAPLTLPLVIPLGLLSFKPANVLWLFLIVSSIAVSMHLLRELHGETTSRIHLLGYAFAPTLICVSAGQIVAFSLFGMVVFLLMYKTRPFIAGVALSICAIKPHLLLPFGVALLLWTLCEKQTRVALGVFIGILTASAIATVIRPSIWMDYFAMMRTGRLDQEFMPTPSALLRLAIHPAWAWLQIVPAVVACLWAAWYYLEHRKDWIWAGHNGYLLILVSLLVAPRAWVTDEILAVPALLFLFYDGCPRAALYWLAGASTVALVEMFAAVQITSGFYVWTSTAWLACYLIAAPPASPLVPSLDGAVSTSAQPREPT